MFIDENTSDIDLERVLAAAAAAAPELAARSLTERAAILRSVAARIEEAGDRLVAVAHTETHIPEQRLRGELVRTLFQLRLLADEAEEGKLAGAVIDHADADWPMGSRPDLRRVNVPVGPVLVFAASNFPFAFSVAGGDTASALAAGCPVVLKAHPYHPRLSVLTGDAVSQGVRDAGGPEGTFAIVTGREAGVVALKDERIAAGAFTGSVEGGRVLFEVASSRRRPIPFYGELSSVNPVFVTPRASAQRGLQIADELMRSFTLGAGQLCTKPGIVFVPRGSEIPVETARLASEASPVPLLHEGIASSFQQSVNRVMERAGVDVLVQVAPASKLALGATVLSTTGTRFREDQQEIGVECFGPAVLFVSYEDKDELRALAESFEGELTASIQGESGESIAAELVVLLTGRVGRMLWNGWPTGVSVTYSQQHGGPYPATTAAASTSVGTAAPFRFLRPVAYQGMPAELLPKELQDRNPWNIPRVVNGVHVPRLKG